MGKHWRRTGRVGPTGGPALTLIDIGGGLYSAEPNAEFLAVPAASVDTFAIWDGGVPELITDDAVWPYAAEVIDSVGHAGQTLQARFVLDTGLTVNSNIVEVP